MLEERRAARPDEQPDDIPVIPRFGTIAIVAYALFAGVVLYGSWRILSPFLTPILLAAVVVMLTFGMFERLA
ncbi:MAG: hypothetical protein LC732_00345, partial [Acidobacteria bacterium]|nr:hypothetical protein [Acidobacteriota bacterium]